MHPVLVCSTFFWIRCQSRIVRKCSTQFLESRKKTMRTLYFWYSFAQLEQLYIAQFEDHRLAEWVVDVILLQVGVKCFWMRMIFDLLHKLVNSEMFCFFHNCMWQSWYSEVNVVLLHLYGPLRSCWVLDVLVTKQDIFLDLGGSLSVSLLLPATSESNSFIQLSLKEIFGGGRGDTSFLVYDFSRFHHHNFRDTISWECIVKDDCITSCLI